MEKYICIDIGGTSIKYGVVLENGDIIEKSSMDTEAREKGGPGILNKIKRIVNMYIGIYEIRGI